MSSYDQLKTLLEVRRTAEAAAERVLAARTDQRARAASAQIRLDEATGRAQDELRQGREPGAASAVEGADRALARQHFLRRLGEKARIGEARATRHRDGPLREAEAAWALSREALTLARQQRAAVEKQLQRDQEARRQIGARREEQALEDQARAARAVAARAGGKDPPS